jgi:hypothetical protein
MRSVWLYPLLLIALFEGEISLYLKTASFRINVLYFLINLTPLILLYISLEKAYKSPTRFWRNARGTLLTANALWSVDVIHHAFIYYNRWEFYTLKDCALSLLLDIIISAGIVYIYRRYFFRTK